MAETGFERKPGALWRSNAAARLRTAVVSWPLLLALILLVGGALRFNGLDWDQPAGAEHPLQMHPDERFLSLVAERIHWPSGVGGYFDTEHSPLNPYNDPETHSFVYGTFPLFLAKGVAGIAGGSSYDTTVEWGRRITALFDTATIALVFGIGWVLGSRRAGLAGAALYGLAVLPTQLAHFWTMDPFLTFFLTATLLQSLLFVGSKRPRASWGLAGGIGVTLGLALACKVNALLFVPVVPLAAALRIGLRDFPALGLRWRTAKVAPAGNWLSDCSMAMFALFVALIVFRIAQPYAFAGPHFWDMALNPMWKSDLQREFDYQDGIVDYPPFIQFAGRTPFVAPLGNLVVWGTGPALGLAGVVGLVAGAVVLFRRRELSWALPLVAVGAVFGFQGMRFVAFMRYFEPMYPVLCAAAGVGLAWLFGWAVGGLRGQDSGRRALTPGPSPTAEGEGRRWWARRVALAGRRGRVVRWGALGLVGAVFAATLWWAVAFQNVYRSTNPRIAASEWIDTNVPQGSRLTYEYWDDSLPYALPGHPGGMYYGIALHLYDTDSTEKVRELVYGRPDDNGIGGLINADYVIVSSTRVRESVAKLPAEYPATNLYYQLLDSGALGFEPVATFAVEPSFLGIGVNDSKAEESFTVYDHPTVRIYQRTTAFDPVKAVALLDTAHPERAINLLPKQGRTNGLQLTASEAATQQGGGTFTDVFDAHGWASSAPWLWWFLWLEVAAFAAVPWVTWLFRALPDRGYGLSKLLGLGAVVVPTWLLVAWGGPHFSGALVWGVFAGALAAGAALGWWRRGSIIAEAREAWGMWVAVEVVFVAAFAAFLLLRVYNPDLWFDPLGGEKPMDIAYLTAVTRSTTLPPYDPWFGGGSMNYYYMGWFFLAVPIRALRIVPEVAFNLGIPTFAALGATVAYSTVYNLVGLSRRTTAAAGAAARNWRRPALFAGLLGAVLLLGIANLDGAHQTVERVQAVNHWSLFSGVPVLGGAVGIVGGLARWVTGAALPPFDWWRSSRVHFGSFDITEFPFFSLLFADLHPQLMDVPFFGLVIAMVVGYVATARAGLRAQSWALAAGIGLAVALVRMVHTWDFPTAVLMGGGGIVVGQLVAAGRWQERWWRLVGHGAVAAAVLVAPFAPYTAHFETFDPGLVRSPETTPVQQYFVQFGVFVAFALLFLAVRYREELTWRAGDHGRNPFLAAVNGRVELAALAVFVLGLGAFAYTLTVTTLALTALLEVALLNLLWLEFQHRERNVGRILGTAMFALAFVISAGVDVVTLKNDIERMNTVFKFGLQAWQLFALASAFSAWYSGRALWQVRDWRIRARPGRKVAAVGATAVMVVLLFGAGIFLEAGTKSRQEDRFGGGGPTLDGLAFMQKAQYREALNPTNPADDVTIKVEDDRPLIDWLRDNVQGSPVIAEEVGPLYHWTGRISEYTGLPAVIGWDWHQIQQRTDYQDLVDQRRADTEQFYGGTSAASASQYLLKYNVRYVVVGTEEYARATPDSLAKFGSMPELKEVFTSGRYHIYEVDPSKLPAAQ